MSNPLILEGMSKSFGGVVAVDGVSLALEDGERHAILGPNGAGKTTLFNLISGIHHATSGRILLFGKDVTATPQHVRVSMGLGRTFQVTNLFQSLTVFENIRLAAQAQKSYRLSPFKPVEMYKGLLSQVRDILFEWHLEEIKDVEVSNLSYGEQRQLEVVMALATSPRLLLLDEPTAGLSPPETREMTRFLSRLEPSTTLLLIEHDMDVVFAIADKITVMHYGKILVQGPPEKIKGHPKVMEIYLGQDWEKHALR